MLQYQLSQVLQIFEKSVKELVSGFDFWVVSEVAKAKVVNWRLYLELVELSADAEVIAKSKAVMFDSYLYTNFLKQIWYKSFEELHWYKFLFYWRFSFHQEYGLSIIVNDISLEYSLGQIKKTQNSIIERLQTLWIYWLNKQKTLPLRPLKVAVISSKTSEWLRDFSQILKESNYNVSLHLYEASIHWNTAKLEVLEALYKVLTGINEGKQLDLVVILRWGWGTSGLLWQDDFDIASQLCQFPSPIMLAIGHTADTSVLDQLVAFPAKTPSQAAYMIIEHYDVLYSQIQELKQSIASNLVQKLGHLLQSVAFTYKQIQASLEFKQKFFTQSVESLYNIIRAFDPHNLIKQGYALVKSQQWKAVTQNELTDLQNKSVVVELYSHELDVTVNKVRKKSSD